MSEKTKCFLCDSDQEVEFCFGCKKYICQMHDTVFGRHKPDDHDENDDV